MLALRPLFADLFDNGGNVETPFVCMTADPAHAIAYASMTKQSPYPGNQLPRYKPNARKGIWVPTNQVVGAVVITMHNLRDMELHHPAYVPELNTRNLMSVAYRIVSEHEMTFPGFLDNVVGFVPIIFPDVASKVPNDVSKEDIKKIFHPAWSDAITTKIRDILRYGAFVHRVWYDNNSGVQAELLSYAREHPLEAPAGLRKNSVSPGERALRQTRAFNEFDLDTPANLLKANGVAADARRLSNDAHLPRTPSNRSPTTSASSSLAGSQSSERGELASPFRPFPSNLMTLSSDDRNDDDDNEDNNDDNGTSKAATSGARRSVC
jgi:hypothetical protein